MKLAKTLKIIFFSLLFLAVVAYVIYTFFGMESTNPEEECAEVAVIIDEEDHDAFVDSTAVMQMLNEAEINPVGRKMKFVDLDEIKRIVEKNPFVTSAECYSNNNGMEVGKARVCVKVHQLVPVALVYDRHDVSYYVDASGNIIETDSLFPRNILVANGEINRNFVVSDLAAFANYIHSDDFWDNQIEQVYVEYDKNKERVVTLIPRVGEQRIYLGPITDYDKKLKRLRKFYEQGMSVVGWNKYSVLNLEYDNQVKRFIELTGEKPGYIDPHAWFNETTNRAMNDIIEKYGCRSSTKLINPSDSSFLRIGGWSKPVIREDKSYDYSVNTRLAQDPLEYWNSGLKEEIIRHAPEDVLCMLHTHAGFLDRDLYRLSSFSAVRPMEAGFLCSEEMRSFVRDYNIELVNYSYFD